MNILHKIQLATLIAIITSVSILVYVDQAYSESTINLKLVSHKEPGVHSEPANFFEPNHPPPSKCKSGPSPGEHWVFNEEQCEWTNNTVTIDPVISPICGPGPVLENGPCPDYEEPTIEYQIMNGINSIITQIQKFFGVYVDHIIST